MKISELFEDDDDILTPADKERMLTHVLSKFDNGDDQPMRDINDVVWSLYDDQLPLTSRDGQYTLDGSYTSEEQGDDNDDYGDVQTVHTCKMHVKRGDDTIVNFTIVVVTRGHDGDEPMYHGDADLEEVS